MDDSKTPILVTGATGFIGKRLIDRLLSENIPVIAADLPGKMPAEWHGRLTYIPMNITKPAEVKTAVSHAKTIVHLAAIVTDWGDDSLYEQVTVQGTKHLLDAASNSPHNPHVIIASSITTYGDNLAKGRCDETTPMGRPYGPYSRTKQAQEKLAHRYMNSDMPITILRIANVFGASSAVWVDTLCRELRRGTPALLGGGDFNAALTHVNNVVEMICCVAQNKASIGETFNVADQSGVTWKQYCGQLAKSIGAKPPRSLPNSAAWVIASLSERIFKLFRIKNRPPITREAVNLVGSPLDIPITKAITSLGYQPPVNFDTAMREVRKYLESSL